MSILNAPFSALHIYFLDRYKYMYLKVRKKQSKWFFLTNDHMPPQTKGQQHALLNQRQFFTLQNNFFLEAYCSDGLQSDSAPVLSSPDQAGRVTCQSSDIREVNLAPSGSLRWEQGMRDQPLAEWFMSLVNFWLPWADCPIDSWWRLGSNGYRKSSVSLRLLALER